LDDVSIARLEEKVAAEVSHARTLFTELEVLSRNLSASEKTYLKGRLINALRARFDEYQAFEETEVQPLLRRLGFGGVIATTVLAVVGAGLPALLAGAFTMIMATQSLMSHLSQWFKQKSTQNISSRIQSSLN